MITREGLRKKFAECSFSYSKLNSNDLIFLMKFIRIELKKHKDFKMFLSEKVDIKFNEDTLKYFYLRVNGPYFENREAISFNIDGFIGFCGWASSNNSKPFLTAFDNWIYCLHQIKEQEK